MKKFSEKKEISLDELLKEMEALRGKSRSQIVLTEEQKTFLKAGRECNRPVTWIDLKNLWNKKWDPITENALRSRYTRYVKGT